MELGKSNELGNAMKEYLINKKPQLERILIYKYEKLDNETLLNKVKSQFGSKILIDKK